MNFQFYKMTCFTKKNPKKMHANLIKYQVENCPTLPEQNLISICNRRVKSVSAGQIEISSRQSRDHVITTLETFMLNLIFLTHPSLKILGKTQTGVFIIFRFLVNPL